MLKRIEEFGKYVELVGFRNVRIGDFDDFLAKIRKEKRQNVEIQFFDAKFIATWQHLYFAVLNALTAFRNGENISKDLAMETMLYASAQRQIRKSMEFLGVKPGSSNIAVLIIGEKPEAMKFAISIVSKYIRGQRDDEVLELTEEKSGIIRDVFQVTETELKTIAKERDFETALVNLVIERMALLTSQR